MSAGLCWVAVVVAATIAVGEGTLLVWRFARRGRHHLRTGRTWPPRRRSGDER